jgi:hypothetical protein
MGSQIKLYEPLTVLCACHIKAKVVNPLIAVDSSTEVVHFSFHIARMGEMRNAHKIFIRKPEGKRSRGRPTLRWGRMLEWILWKWYGEVWTASIMLRIRTSGGIL